MIQPKFPLISCDTAERLQIIDAEEELTRASSLELIAQSKGKAATYFDSDHHTWILTQTARSFHNDTLTRLTTLFIYSRIHKVDLSWQIGRSYSLQEIKNRLLAFVKRKDRFQKLVDLAVPSAAFFGGSDLHPDEIYQLIIDHCKSFADIIDILEVWLKPVTPEEMNDVGEFRGI